MEKTSDLGAVSLLNENVFLNSAEAVLWLSERGIHTSRSGLDVARNTGRLNYLRVRGKSRILYSPADLARAFVVEYVDNNQAPSNSQLARRSHNKIRSNQDKYEQALAMCAKKNATKP